MRNMRYKLLIENSQVCESYSILEISKVCGKKAKPGNTVEIWWLDTTKWKLLDSCIWPG